ncbi:Bor/Iss family lipoprotein [Escherichia coli]|uniref:Bor/Iss family lipoprotein n=1 Tax=Escherichia coli TaxID=562 RepID=UPI003AF2A9DC
MQDNKIAKNVVFLPLWHAYYRCAQQTFTAGTPTAVHQRKPSPHHFFVSGIVQENTVDAAKLCGGAENDC